LNINICQETYWTCPWYVNDIEQKKRHFEHIPQNTVHFESRLSHWGRGGGDLHEDI